MLPRGHPSLLIQPKHDLFFKHDIVLCCWVGPCSCCIPLILRWEQHTPLGGRVASLLCRPSVHVHLWSRPPPLSWRPFRGPIPCHEGFRVQPSATCGPPLGTSVAVQALWAQSSGSTAVLSTTLVRYSAGPVVHSRSPILKAITTGAVSPLNMADSTSPNMMNRVIIL